MGQIFLSWNTGLTNYIWKCQYYPLHVILRFSSDDLNELLSLNTERLIEVDLSNTEQHLLVVNFSQNFPYLSHITWNCALLKDGTSPVIVTRSLLCIGSPVWRGSLFGYQIGNRLILDQLRPLVAAGALMSTSHLLLVMELHCNIN